MNACSPPAGLLLKCSLLLKCLLRGEGVEFLRSSCIYI